MASTDVPTLTSFVSGSGKKLDILMTNFAISNYSQSYCYQGHISSLAYLIATSQYNGDRLEKATNDLLTKYLKRFYDTVELRVTVSYMNPETERLDLEVGGFVVEKGVSYDMAGLLMAERGKFYQWKGENNG